MSSQIIKHDVFLNPGDLHFSLRPSRIKTLLGSCVSMVIWHPQLKIGGMCHFILPTRLQPGNQLDGRYGDEAMALLLRRIDAQGRPRKEFQVKLFGGASVLEQGSNGNLGSDVGIRNILAARSLVRAHGFNITSEHLGGKGHRVLVFDVATGEVLMKHVSSPASNDQPAMNLNSKNGVSQVVDDSARSDNLVFPIKPTYKPRVN